MASRAREIANWIRDSVVWDTRGQVFGLLGSVWAARKLIVVFTATLFLTWREWVEHHPPEVVILALVHFVFVFGIVSLLVLALQWLARLAKWQPKP